MILHKQMHVLLWLNEYDAQCSATENPIVPYLCAFCGQPLIMEDFLSEKTKTNLKSVLCRGC